MYQGAGGEAPMDDDEGPAPICGSSAGPKIEVMNILKASLTSISALTDGLIKPLLKKKQPKQELPL